MNNEEDDGLTGQDTGIAGHGVVKLATQESKQDVDDGRGHGRSLLGRGWWFKSRWCGLFNFKSLLDKYVVK